MMLMYLLRSRTFSSASESIACFLCGLISAFCVVCAESVVATRPTNNKLRKYFKRNIFCYLLFDLLLPGKFNLRDLSRTIELQVCDRIEILLLIFQVIE